jgi:hypothetical protein
MALVYSYTHVLGTPTIGNITKQRAKAKKAIMKKGLPEKIADEFLDKIIDEGKLGKLLRPLSNAVTASKEKTLGFETLKENSGNPLVKAVFAQIVAKQVMVKFSDVFLEIHIKSSALQLWFHAKGGGTEIVTEWKGARL